MICQAMLKMRRFSPHSRWRREKSHSPESVQRLSDLAGASQEVAEILLPVMAVRHSQ